MNLAPFSDTLARGRIWQLKPCVCILTQCPALPSYPEKTSDIESSIPNSNWLPESGLALQQRSRKRKVLLSLLPSSPSILLMRCLLPCSHAHWSREPCSFQLSVGTEANRRGWKSEILCRALTSPFLATNHVTHLYSLSTSSVP